MARKDYPRFPAMSMIALKKGQFGNGIVNPGLPSLIPNIVAPPTMIAGPISSLATVDTGSYAHYIRAKVATAPDAAALSAMLLPSGKGRLSTFFIYGGNGGRFAGSSREADGSLSAMTGSGETNPNFAAMPRSIEVGDTMMVARTTTGQMIFSLEAPNGEVTEVYSFNFGAIDENTSVYGTFVAISNRGGTYTNVEYGGYAVPLRIDSTSLVSGYRPQSSIVYVGAPDTYQGQIESAGGAVLVPWTDAVVSDASKGRAVLTMPIGIPTSEFGTSPRIRWRQKNLTTVSQSAIVAMPEGKARIGVNMTIASESAAERIFKDLFLFNDGYRNGGAYLNTSEWIDADGNLNKIPTDTGKATYAFGRCNVPGARCEITWEGGDDPSWLSLDEGSGVTYGNVTQTGRSIQFNYNHSWDTKAAFGRVKITAVNPSNKIRNIRCKEVAASWDGGVFDEGCIARYSKYSYVRLMDVMGSNAINGLPTDMPYYYEFADRSTPTKPNNNRLGWCAEWVIEFANRTGCDVWCMMPAASSPDYDTKFCRGLFYGEGMVGGVKLDAARMALFAKANEWFNSGFGIYHQAGAAAKANGRVPADTPENDARIAEQAYRIKLMFDALTGNFPAGRLKKVFEASPVNLYEANQIYDVYNVRNFDIFSTAYYFFNIQFAEQPDKWPGKNVAAMLAFAQSTIASGLADVRNNSDWAKARGYGYWIYEGQQHWFEPTSTLPYYDEDFNTAVQQADGMEFVFDEWFDSWTNNFSGGLTGYYPIGAPSLKSGSWGFQLNQTDASLAKSPKQRSMNKALAKLQAQGN